jgi:hypothetical protein
LGLPFRDLLPESTIIEALAAENITYRIRLFDPFVTLWTLLSQVLDTDKSCANAVSRVIAWLASEGAPIPASDTSAYCQARSRLPENLLQRLFSNVGQKLSNQVRPEHLWRGRHALVIEGQPFLCLTLLNIKLPILNPVVNLKVVASLLLKLVFCLVSLRVQPSL